LAVLGERLFRGLALRMWAEYGLIADVECQRMTNWGGRKHAPSFLQQVGRKVEVLTEVGVVDDVAEWMTSREGERDPCERGIMS
jgi:hypothetical protein